jgi:hypothetical protein
MFRTLTRRRRLVAAISAAIDLSDSRLKAQPEESQEAIPSRMILIEETSRKLRVASGRISLAFRREFRVIILVNERI